MKILLIKGSLRGENSHSLMVARKFVEGICEETDSEVKEIYLGNTRIERIAEGVSPVGKSLPADVQ